MSVPKIGLRYSNYSIPRKQQNHFLSSSVFYVQCGLSMPFWKNQYNQMGFYSFFIWAVLGFYSLLLNFLAGLTQIFIVVSHFFFKFAPCNQAQCSSATPKADDEKDKLALGKNDVIFTSVITATENRTFHIAR